MILLFKLLSHSTHLTQSLNVGVFQSMKYYHIEAIDNFIRIRDADFDELDCLDAFNRFKTQTFRSITIRSAWVKVELILFNSKMILSKIRALNANASFVSRLSISSSKSLTLSYILKKLKDVIKAERDIVQQINNNEKVSSTKLTRFVKEVVARMNLLKLIQQDLQVTHTAALIKRTRKKLAEIVVQKSEMIFVDEIRFNHISRTQKEVKREKSRQKRVETARQKKIISSWEEHCEAIWFDEKKDRKLNEWSLAIDFE